MSNSVFVPAVSDSGGSTFYCVQQYDRLKVSQKKVNPQQIHVEGSRTIYYPVPMTQNCRWSPVWYNALTPCGYQRLVNECLERRQPPTHSCHATLSDLLSVICHRLRHFTCV